MSCNYCWNQPKKYERYDLYLDGKIKADDFVYRTKDESGEISTTTLSEKIDEIESRLQTHFTFKHVEKLPTEGEETVIYLVPNAETSGDKDGYDEYMWVKKEDGTGGFELIGSGSYAQQQAELNAESNRAKAAEETLTKKIDQEIKDRTNAVKAEKERAEEVENKLDTRIKAFEEGEGGRIEEKIDQEIEDRIVSESAIANVINDIDLKI